MSNVLPSNNAPVNPTLDSIVPAPRDRSDRSELYLNLETKWVELERQKLLNEELSRNIQERSAWAKRVFALLIAWLITVIAVLFCQGFAQTKFHLDNSVLITFITTTTLNVVSLGYIVANYLFPKPK
jgi:hypothetical protein